MSILFISDLHLKEERPDLTRAFFDFLDQKVSDQDTLYILGDFFEIWMGDDLATPFQREVTERLAELPKRGIKTFFMHGNRDFIVGKSFCRDAQCTLIQDPTPIKLGLTPALLSHGDHWCTSDEKYQKYRRVVRNPIMQWVFMKLPKRVRQNIANKIRESSKNRPPQEDYSILDVTEASIEQEMLDKQIPLVIHGHTHRPARHPMQQVALALNCSSAERIVLGDWDKTGWYLKFENQQLDLIEFDI